MIVCQIYCVLVYLSNNKQYEDCWISSLFLLVFSVLIFRSIIIPTSTMFAISKMPTRTSETILNVLRFVFFIIFFLYFIVAF